MEHSRQVEKPFMNAVFWVRTPQCLRWKDRHSRVYEQARWAGVGPNRMLGRGGEPGVCASPLPYTREQVAGADLHHSAPEQTSRPYGVLLER